MSRTALRSKWTYALVGVVAGALLLAGFGPPGLLLPHSETCQLGPSIGTYTIWTPVMLANIPDGGNASVFAAGFNYTMTSGSLNVGTTPTIPLNHGYGLTLSTAGIHGVFLNENWTFHRTTNVSTLGSGGNPCTQPYVAVFAGQPGYCEGDGIIPIPVNSSDVTEPHEWNGTPSSNWFNLNPGCPYSTPGASVWFDTTLHTGGPGVTFGLNLCNMSGNYPMELDGPAYVPVVMTVPYHGGRVSASGYLTWLGDSTGDPDFTTASYNLPMGWSWNYGYVGPQPSTSGLLAFERLSCPG